MSDDEYEGRLDVIKGLILHDLTFKIYRKEKIDGRIDKNMKIAQKKLRLVK